MPLQGYSIRDRNGDRIPANECNIQPLNFFLPGNAPILVPKRSCRDNPNAAFAVNKSKDEKKNGKHSSGCKTKEPEGIDSKDKDATDTDDEDEADAQPLLGKKTAKSKLQKKPAPTVECKKKSQKHKHRVAKQPQESEATHQQTAPSARKRKHDKRLVEPPSDGEESATDASSKVRDILANLKIRAAGLDVDDTFTPSEEFQLLVLKNNGETWNDISETMKRPKAQIKKHYKHLKSIGTKIPGQDDGDDDDGNVVVGKSSEDVDAASDTGAIIASSSSDEKLEDSKKKAIGTSRKKLKKKQPKYSPKTRKKNKEDAHLGATAIASAAEPAAAPDVPDFDEAVDKTAIKAYIGQNATQLIKDHRAGRVTIPEPDDKFSEDDCVLLALANYRHATNRWLHIQAEFANFTDRLVPEEVLKWKLGEGDKPDDY